MKEETIFMKTILPKHYKCEPREQGVHCCSDIGIKDTFSHEEVIRGENDHWALIEKAIMQRFGDRLMEIFSQTSTRHKKFTVYIKL